MAKLPICLIASGIVVSAMSFFMGFFIIPDQVRNGVQEAIRIEEGNDVWKSWVRVPFKLYIRFYLFNVTNSEDVMAGKAKPILQELGPYVYEQIRDKTDIVVNNENGTIFYKQPVDYFFQPEMSRGTENDIVVMPNLPFLGAADQIAKLDWFSRGIVTPIFNVKHKIEKMYVVRTVGEMLFKGYYVPFMKDMSGLQGEEILPNNTFSMYYGQNGTTKNTLEIFSGVQDGLRYAKVASFNGKRKLDVWKNEYCDKINGSFEARFSPFVEEDRILELFTPDLCRTLKFSFDEKVEMMGMPCYKYSISDNFLEDPRINPDNMCFCTDPGNDFENCPRKGVFQINACRQGAPILMSLPHFYRGSEFYLNQIEGLNPVKEKHETAITLETNTGGTAQISIRLQVNIQVRRNKYIRSLRKIEDVIHPVMWVENTAGMTEDNAANIRNVLLRVIHLTPIVTWILICLGGVLSVAGIFVFFCSSAEKKKKISDTKPSILPVRRLNKSDIVLASVANHDESDLPETKLMSFIPQDHA